MQRHRCQEHGGITSSVPCLTQAGVQLVAHLPAIKTIAVANNTADPVAQPANQKNISCFPLVRSVARARGLVWRRRRHGRTPTNKETVGSPPPEIPARADATGGQLHGRHLTLQFCRALVSQEILSFSCDAIGAAR